MHPYVLQVLTFAILSISLLVPRFFLAPRNPCALNNSKNCALDGVHVSPASLENVTLASLVGFGQFGAYPVVSFDWDMILIFKYGNASQYVTRRSMSSYSQTRLYRAMNLETNSLVMLKQYPPSDNYLRRELIALSTLPLSDYVIEAKDLLPPTKNGTSPTLVTEYLEYSMNDLFQRFARPNSSVTFIRSFTPVLMRQYLKGLLELKSSNVLLNHYWRSSLRANYTHPELNSLRVKIAEMGYVGLGPFTNETPYLVCPEIISVAPEALLCTNMVGHALDMWDMVLLLLDFAYYDRSDWKIDIENLATKFSDATSLPIHFIRYYCYIVFIHGQDWLPDEHEWTNVTKLPHYGLFWQMKLYLAQFLDDNNLAFPKMNKAKIEHVLGADGLDLLNSASQRDPLKRISVEHALLHPFITQTGSK